MVYRTANTQPEEEREFTKTVVPTRIKAGLNFQIEENGLLSNRISLPISTYCLEIRAHDGLGSYCSASITIIVEDTTAPVWNFLPMDQNVEFGSEFSYDLNASDLSSINSYWINDTGNFQISGTGGISNKTSLEIGIHCLEVQAYDDSGNYCSVTITVTVDDTTDPTWDFIPMDQNVEFGSAFSYALEATDLSDIESYWVNDTENFQIDENGLLTNKTFLEIGIYGLEIRAYDYLGNYCSSTITIAMTIKESNDGDDNGDTDSDDVPTDGLGNNIGYILMAPVGGGIVAIFMKMKKKKVI